LSVSQSGKRNDMAHPRPTTENWAGFLKAAQMGATAKKAIEDWAEANNAIRYATTEAVDGEH
jgi:hypothetical protein